MGMERVINGRMRDEREGVGSWEVRRMGGG